jgi:hypothetical protein
MLSLVLKKLGKGTLLSQIQKNIMLPLEGLYFEPRSERIEGNRGETFPEPLEQTIEPGSPEHREALDIA